MKDRKSHPIEEFLFRCMLNKDINSDQQLKFIQASLHAITRLRAGTSALDVYNEFKNQAGSETNLKDKDFQQDFLPNFEGWFERNGRAGTMLTWAAAEGYPRYVSLLIESKADVNFIDFRGVTAIRGAVDFNKLACIKELIAVKANVNIKDNDDLTALMVTAEKGHDECLQVLIESKADLNAINKDQDTALMLAASKDKSRCIHKLVAAKADVNLKDKHDQTALMVAAGQGHDECLQVLIESKVDLKVKNKAQITALLAAVSNNKHKSVQKLLTAKADVNDKDNDGVTALMIAIAEGHDECFQVLIESKANLNAKCKKELTALMFAVLGNKHKYIQKLVAAKADMNLKNFNDDSALMLAAEKGHDEILRVLIESKADLNLKDCDGQTALILASQKGHDKCLQVLIESNADLNAKDKQQETALTQSVFNNKTLCVKKLLSANADIAGVLDIAKKNTSMLSLLLESNAVTPHYNMPLIQTILQMGTECKLEEDKIYFMLDKHIKDTTQFTSLQWAAVLIYAVINNNPAAVKWFFHNSQQYKVKINLGIHDKFGMTALWHSVAYTDSLRDSKEDFIVKKRQIVNLLIQQTLLQSKKMEEKIAELLESLEMIVLYNNLYAIEAMVNAVIHYAGDKMELAIHFLIKLFEAAVITNNVEILNILIGIIEKDNKFNFKNKIIQIGHLLITAAINRGSFNIAEILICHDFLTSEHFSDNQSLVNYLIYHFKDIKITEEQLTNLFQLILVKCNPSREIKNRLLINASEVGVAALIKLLVEHKANINIKKAFFDSTLYSPSLDKAVEQGNIDAVKVLLALGAISTPQTLKKLEQPVTTEKKHEAEKFYRIKKYLHAMDAIMTKNPQVPFLCADLNGDDQKDLYQLFEKHPLNEKGWIDKLFSDHLSKVQKNKEAKQMAVPPSAPLQDKVNPPKVIDIEKEPSIEGMNPDYVHFAIAQKISENESKEMKSLQIEGQPNIAPFVEEEPGHPISQQLAIDEFKFTPSTRLSPSPTFFGNGNAMNDGQYNNMLIQIIQQKPDYWSNYPNGEMMKKMLEAFCQNVSEILSKPQQNANFLSKK